MAQLLRHRQTKGPGTDKLRLWWKEPVLYSTLRPSKLRWTIEPFFAWWKHHLKVYHLIARSPYGLLMQILSGLITYLLLAIYCHEEHGERVSIQRALELRNKIRNEAAEGAEFSGPGPPGIVDLDFSAFATS